MEFKKLKRNGANNVNSAKLSLNLYITDKRVVFDKTFWNSMFPENVKIRRVSYGVENDVVFIGCVPSNGVGRKSDNAELMNALNALDTNRFHLEATDEEGVYKVVPLPYKKWTERKGNFTLGAKDVETVDAGANVANENTTSGELMSDINALIKSDDIENTVTVDALPTVLLSNAYVDDAFEALFGNMK